MRETEHLHVLGQVGEGYQSRTRTVLVEVHEQIIEDERKGLAAFGELAQRRDA